MNLQAIANHSCTLKLSKENLDKTDNSSGEVDVKLIYSIRSSLGSEKDSSIDNKIKKSKTGISAKARAKRIIPPKRQWIRVRRK